MLKDISPDWSPSFPGTIARGRPRQAAPTCPRADVELDRDTLIRNGIWAFESFDVRSRSFVLLRSQLMSRFHASGGRVLAVTSTRPAEGKTFVTANLAAALSRIHPTVLIDLDLRRPSIATRFGLTVDCGVEDFLAGNADWSMTGQKIASTQLTIHGARQPGADTAEMLASDALRGVFASFKALPGAPICIVDTPPILMLDDANLIARHVDGVLMVIEEGRTRGRDIEEALRLLGTTPVVGSVLNKSLAISKSNVDYAYYDDLKSRRSN
jgi:capsular exopolysaccharide synthesis family protein